VSVLTGNPNYPEGKVYSGYFAWGYKHSVWRDVSVFRVPIIPRGSGSALRLTLNYLSFILTASLLGVWMLRKVRPDVVYCFAPSPLLQALPAILIKNLKRAPLALNVQDLWPESLQATDHIKNAFIIRLIDRVVRFIYRNADLILVSSRPFVEYVKRFSSVTPIVYYPNSAGTHFKNPTNKKFLDVPALNQGFCVVFAGNVGVAQAVQVLVGAAERLSYESRIRLVVLGTGSRLAWLKQKKEEKGLSNLYLLGRFPEEMMPFMLSKASVLLVMLADRNIFSLTVPSKIQAYLAVGRPIIACLNGEGGKIVKESRAGVAVPAENPLGLANAILEMFSRTQDELTAMGLYGRAYYEANFNHEKLITDLIRHFYTLLEDEK
jgi:glycosyltransferase involved in cell wall biosynthesis